jgi:MerR family mercuric resistance operon transcriptional regulator
LTLYLGARLILQGVTPRLTIGQLAKLTSVHVQTLRFYEREGLLLKPARTAAGYRHYPASAVDRIAFIRRAKDLGFTLEEIAELLALRVTLGRSCESVRARAVRKLHDIEIKIRELEHMRRALQTLVARCSGDEAIDACTILEAISRGAGSDPPPPTPVNLRGKRRAS